MTQRPYAAPYRLHLVLLFVLIVFASLLRITNLGYSEFQDDEKKALIRKAPNQSTWNFFMNQRKGPMQFLVAAIPFALTQDMTNEFAQRLPFSIFSVATVVVFYFLAYAVTKHKVAAFISSLFFLSFGFLVGFGRISQYQNLNVFFSLLSLLCFVLMVGSGKHALKTSLLGTLFFCLSLLSHWDAIFYLVPMVFIAFDFVKAPTIEHATKIKVLLTNLFLGCALVLPFMLPYVYSQLSNASNAQYFNRRVGVSLYGSDEHLYIFKLYNPLIWEYVFIGILLISLLLIKHTYRYVFWFIVNFLAIFFLMTKPGTHLYNYLIPLFVIFAVCLATLLRKIPFKLGIVICSPLIVVAGLLWYQSYFLFVDHSVEYPWDKKRLFNQNLPTYRHEQVLTFGFPHFREWKKISKIILSDPDNCLYTTNEGKEISQIYLRDNYGKDPQKCYYLVIVKRPFISTRDNYNFAETKGKEPIYQYIRAGETLTKVYKIPAKKSKTT